ncbi:hypothetical protein EDB83DRAFT_2316248 [Lactarius deliciosus]|nr:hypothetical protein EDB83DRAFT_2316248 [Lactarius deliciosus]
MTRHSSNKPKPSAATNTQLESVTSAEEFSLQDVEDEDDLPDSPGPSDDPLALAPTNHRSVTTRTKALDILYFFTEVESSTADGTKVVQKACNICIKSYGANKGKAPKDSPNYFYAKSTGISNLRRHLNNLHCTEYDLAAAKYNWPPKLSSQSGVASTHNDRKLRNPDIPPFSPSSFLDHLARFIVMDDQSIRVVECPKFRQLCMVLHETLVNADIPSVNLVSYLALTAHWISSDKSTGHLTLRAALIGFHHLKNKHTGCNIARTILHLIDWANITIKIGHFTLNNAENDAVAMLKATTDSGYAVGNASQDDLDDNSDGESDDGNIKFRHDIAELKLADSFFDSGNVKLDAWFAGIKRNPLKRARRAIHLLRSTGPNRETFKVFIHKGNNNNWFKKRKGGERVPVKVPLVDLLRDVKTRWDSAYLMLERLRELHLVHSFRQLDSGY